MAEQSYKNHTRWLPAFHFFAVPVLLINTINELRHLYANPSQSTAWAAVVAAAMLTVAFLARRGSELEFCLPKLTVGCAV